MSMSVGEVVAAVSGLSGAVATLWTLFGKSKTDSFTRLEGERNRLDAKVAELETKQQAQSERLDKVEAELEALRLDHKTLLDFLRDIVSGRFDGEWVKGRAEDLLARFGGTKV